MVAKTVFLPEFLIKRRGLFIEKNFVKCFAYLRKFDGIPITGGLLLPVESPPWDTGDWRTSCSLIHDKRIVNKIMDTLKRHLPFSGQEGLNELRKIAVRFEEKIFTAANSQSDYLRRISLKMLTMENKSENTIPNTGNNSKAPDPGNCRKQHFALM
ncbi:mediator of RNA polymerase II transcription subunit 15a-like [Durio zibethinus]|uniref:Mediator of RNA polymerase II transcription subunit 15a-like n=1 Tax=Durio zibethinus TaxID=66656 RepID=A0A6P5WVW0_DURZI|nr:mediator of RNA polymerase II transcription subunit 15a-like [Durio zibethinus]